MALPAVIAVELVEQIVEGLAKFEPLRAERVSPEHCCCLRPASGLVKGEWPSLSVACVGRCYFLVCCRGSEV